VLPVDGWRIIRKVVNGSFSGVHIGDKDVMLGHTVREFQVAVGDGTSGVGVGHDAALHLWWKGGRQSMGGMDPSGKGTK
jgi:hypothetical protein